METGESAWATDALQKLLHAMKNSIPQRDTMHIYTKGQRVLDWEKVAFHPYSSEECRQKWQDISQKMRKIRTLTELILEAEDAIDSPLNKVHPERPKKPTPPNAIFNKEKWAKYQEKHPGLSSKRMFMLLNKKYKELPEQKKSKYVKKYQLEHDEYKKSMLHLRKCHKDRDTTHVIITPQTPTGLMSSQAMDKSVQATPDVKREQKHLEESRKDGTPYKPPINGYNLFCKEQKSSLDGVSGKDYITVCAQRWRLLPEEEKDEYKTRSRELKRGYKVELRDYLSDLEEGEKQQILKENGINESTLLRPPKRFRKPIRTFFGEPKMPSRASNVLYCRHQMELLKSDIPNTQDRMAHVSRMWLGLSGQDKREYAEKSHRNFVRYKAELQKWFQTLPAAVQEDYLQHNRMKRQFVCGRKMRTEDGVSNSRPSDSEDEDMVSSTASSTDDEVGEHLGFIEVDDEEIIWHH